MVAALYAIAAAMIVGGSYIASVGYEIILVERGWSQVIAGSVIFTGGLVLLGIATVVWRLGRINKALLTFQARPAAPSTIASFVEQPVVAATPPAKASSSESLDQFAGMKASFEPEQETMSAVALEEERSERLEQEEAKAAELAVAEPLSSFEDEIAREVAARNASAEPSSDSVVMDIEAVDTQPVISSDHWEEPASFEPLVAEATDAPAEHDIQATSFHDEVEQEEEQEAELEIGPEAPPATVIGSYNSGGNQYVMYSDGSIEAHLPNGLHRFSSLDELKQFIGNLKAS